MQSNSVYTLDSEKLDQALAIVERELDVLKSLVLFQEKTAPRINAVIYVFCLGLVTIVIFENHGWISPERSLVTVGIFLALYFAACAVLGWKEIPETRRLRKTQRSLGLEPDGYFRFVGWKEVTLRLVGGIPMLLLGVVGITVVVIGFLVETPAIGDLGFALIAFSGALFARFILGRNLLLFQARLEVAEQLRARLASHRSPAGNKNLTISIPELEYKEIARIERAIINLDRQQAITRNSKKTEPSGLAVQQSAAVIERKSGLEPPVRIKVQMEIDGLSMNPHPPDARREAQGDWHLSIPETDLEIRYTLIDHPPCLLIQGLSNELEPERHTQEQAMAADLKQEFPGYASHITADARAARDVMPSDLRLKVMDIIDQLAMNPNDFENRTKPVPEGKNVYLYEHPDPGLLVTFQLIENTEPRLIKFIQVAALKIEVKRILFISYSHEDREWLTTIRKFLKHLEDQDIAIWDDREIKAGAKWKDEIEKALTNAKAALLLVSQDFLSSDFIKNEELPILLKKAESEGLMIFWIPLRASNVKHTNIWDFQAAVDDPSTSISEVEKPQQERQFVRVYEKIAEALGLL